MLLIDNQEEYPENDYEPIENPDGEDIVPIIDDILDNIEDDNLENIEHEANPLARGEEPQANDNIMIFGLIGVALLVIVGLAFLKIKNKI